MKKLRTMPRSKKSKPSENTSPIEQGALEVSTESRESKESGDLPTISPPTPPQPPAPPKSETTAHNNMMMMMKDNFEDFYLQQITNEFADDIDKIRQASDFKKEEETTSLSVLVAALKQGATIYTEEERRDWEGH